MLFGLAFVAGLFMLVLIHELGHGLMAHQYGLRVRDITLLPFGGVARVEQMPANTRVESMVAVSGSLTNLAITVLLFPPMLLWIFVSDRSLGGMLQQYRFDDPSLSGFVLYLYLANLLLGIVNLLPMFPMDGGRVLRAFLTEFVGRVHATQIAVFTTILMTVAIGVFALASSDVLLVLVCIMLVGFALAESRAVRLEDHLRRMQVGQFAVWDRGGIGPSEPLAIALRDGPRDVVVTAHGAVLGMIWKADLQRALQSGALHKRAGELMDRPHRHRGFRYLSFRCSFDDGRNQPMGAADHREWIVSRYVRQRAPFSRTQRAASANSRATSLHGVHWFTQSGTPRSGAIDFQSMRKPTAIDTCVMLSTTWRHRSRFTGKSPP